MSEKRLRKLSIKYIQKTSKVFDELKLVECPHRIDQTQVEIVIDEAKRYTQDAKYYLNGNKLEVCLASITYCEGLLDALRMLGIIEFSW